MRVCVQCKTEDREIVIPNEGPVRDEDRVHFVKPEIRYLGRAEDFSPQRHGKRGWIYKVFQGRPAMYRNLCVDCINANQQRDKVWAELKRDALRLEKPKNPDSDFYSLLCQ